MIPSPNGYRSLASVQSRKTTLRMPVWPRNPDVSVMKRGSKTLGCINKSAGFVSDLVDRMAVLNHLKSRCWDETHLNEVPSCCTSVFFCSVELPQLFHFVSILFRRLFNSNSSGKRHRIAITGSNACLETNLYQDGVIFFYADDAVQPIFTSERYTKARKSIVYCQININNCCYNLCGLILNPDCH